MDPLVRIEIAGGQKEIPVSYVADWFLVRRTVGSIDGSQTSSPELKHQGCFLPPIVLPACSRRQGLPHLAWHVFAKARKSLGLAQHPKQGRTAGVRDPIGENSLPELPSAHIAHDALLGARFEMSFYHSV